MYNPYYNQNNAFSNYSLYSNPAAGVVGYGQPQKQDIVKVNGENGARAYQMQPNSSVLLLDETQPIIWLKMTDGAGYPTINAYKIEPYTPEVVTQNDLEKRVKRLEELFNESYTVNAAEFKSRKSSESDHVNQKHDERAERR